MGMFGKLKVDNTQLIILRSSFPAGSFNHGQSKHRSVLLKRALPIASLSYISAGSSGTKQIETQMARLSLDSVYTLHGVTKWV